MFYEWQERAVEAIENRDAILSAPTGSGKTWVAYRWAGLMDGEGVPARPRGRVIFTAPIKALSNERYLDLRRMGFDVGLETGDFKKNAGADVLCCTQEIYTLKYAHIPNQRIIIDEFHFIFGSPERTRAYIDGIRGTSPDSRMLVMSATFGDPGAVRSYLEEMGRRDFALFETAERATKLVFRKKGTHTSRIRDALVFVFSKRGADHVAVQIAKTRKKIGRAGRARLREMAEILEVSRTPEVMLSGVGVYYGSLYPKEKLLVEMAFRERIRDALVFVFSKRGADHVAVQIAKMRKKIDRADRARLREMAEILEVSRTPEVMLSGVGVYYGSLYPKEKLLVEMAFRERILDVVVGTDALSLGVNLPAESVIFAQMAKYVDGPLTHNEFLQMAGRAGRKGFFETGYVSFIPRSKTEHHDFDTETLYREVLHSPSEPARIIIQPAVGKLLKKISTPEQEAGMIAECSLPRTSYLQALTDVEELLTLIRRTLGLIRDPRERKRLRDALADLWFDEMSVPGNFAVANLFIHEKEPDAMEAAELLKREERNYLQALLKIKRYANRMPEGYRFSNMERIDATVERMDATVFGFEEKIRQLDLTEDSWSF